MGGIDLVPATIDGLKDGCITVVLDQQALPAGLPAGHPMRDVQEIRADRARSTPASGVVTPETINALVPLIDAGIR